MQFPLSLGHWRYPAYRQMAAQPGLLDCQISRTWVNSQTFLPYHKIHGEQKYKRDTWFIAELLLPVSIRRPVSSVCGSLKCHLGFLKCSAGCLISGTDLQATSWPKVGPGSLSWCFVSSKCHFMTGNEHLPVLWSANGLSFVTGPATVVSEFRQHAMKLNFLLQIELQTSGSGSNSHDWCFIVPYGGAGDHP